MKKEIYNVVVKQNGLEYVSDYVLGLWEYASDMHDFILDTDGNELGKFEVIINWIPNEDEA